MFVGRYNFYIKVFIEVFSPIDNIETNIYITKISKHKKEEAKPPLYTF